MRKAERLLELDPAWRHAQMVGKLSLGHPRLGGRVYVLGIMLHGPRDEIRSPLRSQAPVASGRKMMARIMLRVLVALRVVSW
jgi:hypothetical protein